MRLLSTFLFMLLLSVTATAQITIFDFEGAPPTFEDFNGSVSTIVANPDATEPNTSATVMQNMLPIAQGFAGVKITQNIDLAAGKSFTMQVWSPIENAPVLLKFEGGVNGAPNTEREVNFTGDANSWQELTFNFASEGDNVYDFVVVFMNFNVNTNTEPLTFYWDNLVQNATVSNGDQMDLPVTFDDPAVDYGIIGFEGATAVIAAGPVDATNMVGQVTKAPDSGTSAGATLTSIEGPAGFASQIPFTATATTMSVRVWSPTAGIPVRLKVENANNAGVSVETEAMVTVAAAWDTLTFDFAQQATGTAALNLGSSYNKASIFFGFGSLPAVTTDYFFDDMMFAGGGVGTLPVTLPIDFESTELNYVFDGFEGAASTIEANPDQSGENTSATVMQSVKTDGAQFFAGTFLNLDEPIDFSVDKGISIQTWSPKADIPVRIRLENADNSSGVELDVNTTTTNTWETLEYDFSSLINPNVDYVRVVVFFEFIVDLPGDGSTYYFDNIEVADVGDGSPSVALPVGFEDSTLTYVFGGFEGADSAIEANPDQSGENTSATVMRTIKTDGAQFFAGTFLNLDVPIDFSVNKGISIQSWSPKVGIPVRIRLEDAGNTAGIELDVTTTVASSWETLTADFSGLINPAVNYVKVVVFYEFVVDLPGDGTTYYFDNIEVAEITDDSPPVALPVGFENTNLTYDFAGFEGAESAIEANPDQSGENTSATVMRTTKTDGAQFFAGTFLNLDEPIDLSNTGKIVFSSWSPKANIPVRIRLEDAGNTAGIELDVNTVTASAWETLEVDFSGIQDANVDYVKIVIFYEFVADLPGDGTTYYFDNLSVDELTSTRTLTAEEVQVFPNPTADFWQIASPDARIETLQVFDLSGRQVLSSSPNTNTYEIDARQLPTGTYIVSVTTAEGRRIARLIKQ